MVLGTCLGAAADERQSFFEEAVTYVSLQDGLPMALDSDGVVRKRSLMLVEENYFGGVVDTSVGELADVYQAVLVYPHIDEGTEGGDVGHDARQHHTFFQIFDACDVFVELEDFKFGTRVKAWFVEFFEDVLQRGKSAIG